MTNLLSAFILIFAFLIRLIPISNNHLYFTIDQGRDALYIKDILQGHLTLLGPVTDISRLYHGVGWYYLLAPAYFLFNGHPFGAVLFLILVTCVIFFLLLKFLPKLISLRLALVTVALLTFLLPLYETSRFAFNPYLMAQIGILFLLGLSLTHKNPIYFLLSSFATGMVLHSEFASLVPFLLTYAIASCVFLFKKRIRLIQFLCGWILVLILFLPHIMSEITTNFSQFHAVINFVSGPQSGFPISRTSQIQTIGSAIVSNIGQSILPQNANGGAVIFLFLLVIYFIKKRGSPSYWVIHYLLLLLFTLLWFGTNRGFRQWHLIYIPALTVITFSIILTAMPKKIALLILSTIFFLHVAYSFSVIKLYFQNTTDPGLLSNQMKTINWIYGQSKDSGFSVYTYIPSVYDYQYQYLFPWYGRKKYGFLPCEYSTNPGIDPSLYVPGFQKSKDPISSCPKLFFLILEPAVSQELQQEWYKEVSVNSEIISKTKVGELEIEQRKRL